MYNSVKKKQYLTVYLQIVVDECTEDKFQEISEKEIPEREIPSKLLASICMMHSKS